MATRIPSAAGAMRKRPRQARSRATTAAILEAAAHILGERGWPGTTTNAVAERAGVSIGSLYQYFPNKLALVEAVRQRHFADVLAVLAAAADAAAPRGQRIAALVDGMIGVHARYPAAHRVLLEEAPRAEVGRRARDSFLVECYRAYEQLYLVNARRVPADVRTAARVLAAAVAGVVHDAAHNGTLRASRVRGELLKLVDAYLSS